MAQQTRRVSPRTGTRPQSGDATGRARAKQQEENLPAIQEAARSMTLINPPPQPENPNVVDYSDNSPGGVREIDPSEFEAMLQDEDTEFDATDDALFESEDDGLDDPSIPDGSYDTRLLEEKVLDEPQPKHGRPGQRKNAVVQEAPAPIVAEKAFKMMRVNEDLEDCTIGKNPVTGDLNHYTFRVNTRYRVPRHVYEHLDRIGYVYH